MPSWEGYLRLSRMTCAVTPWAATSEAETVRVNLINPKTNNRINMVMVHAGTREEVDRGGLVEGLCCGEERVLDLMAALRKSLQSGSGRRAVSHHRTKSAARPKRAADTHRRK